MKFVAYYRVSTKKQGQSGLGLSSQKSAVSGYVAKNGGSLVAEFTETESGKNDNRLELKNAINKVKAENAVLVIAKLDRLSRNLNFVTSLMESGIQFVCCDMPDANKFTIHIFSALAQQEREMISDRTKKALAEKKRKGFKLGNPNGFSKSAQEKAQATRRENAIKNENSNIAKERIEEILTLTPNATLQQIADGLNKYGLTTTRGKEFTRSNVSYLVKKVKGL